MKTVITNWKSGNRLRLREPYATSYNSTQATVWMKVGDERAHRVQLRLTKSDLHDLLAGIYRAEEKEER